MWLGPLLRVLSRGLAEAALLDNLRPRRWSSGRHHVRRPLDRRLRTDQRPDKSTDREWTCYRSVPAGAETTVPAGAEATVPAGAEATVPAGAEATVPAGAAIPGVPRHEDC